MIKNILEPLEIALKLEREGKQLFVTAASETKSSLAKKTFEFLAGEEDKHIANIEHFYNSLKDSKGMNIPDVEDSKADERMEDFNRMLEKIKDDFQGTSTDIEAYQMALKFENGAEEFYQKKYDESDNPLIKKFYFWLIQEESMHARLINSCITFVENPEEWFKRRKS